MRWLCTWLDIDFSDRMLSWPAGPRESDGVWAPHWYNAVWASNGFAAETRWRCAQCEMRMPSSFCDPSQLIHRPPLRPRKSAQRLLVEAYQTGFGAELSLLP